MLLLPAAALCCLCSALLTMAAELIQDASTLTRTVGGSVSFSCGGTEQCSGSVVFWYQKKDERDMLRMILSISRSSGAIDRSYNHPQQDDFTAVKKQNSWELEIKTVKAVHSATYYCSCSQSRGDRIFGSGATLYVTDKPVVKPMVSMYPAVSRPHLEGRSTLLCVASFMFPPVVQISWKRQKENGPQEGLPADDQLELRDSDHVASILLIHQQDKSTYKYSCHVSHEGGAEDVRLEEGRSTLPTELPSTMRPPSELSASAWGGSQYQLKLLCLLYTLLIVKSLVYCCGLTLLRLLRNSRKPAD